MGNKEHTNLGLGWKVLNSSWLLLSFVGFAWIGFLIIGKKAKEPKWIKTALVYGILLVGTFTAIGILPSESSLATVCALLWMASVLVSIIHSFIANKKYLICREVLVNANADAAEQQKMKAEIKKRYEEAGVISDDVRDQQAVIETLKKEIVNVNCCTEDDLVKLPGISVVAAKKAINYRDQQNGFVSIEEFYAIADVKPHIMAQLEGLLTCEEYTLSEDCSDIKEKDPKEPYDDDERKGRILDI